MINWNEVTVGETELLSPVNEVWLVVCRNNGKVWLYSDGVHYTRKEDSLGDWTIYDSWEEITEECTWRPFGLSAHLWGVEYKSELIRHNDSRFKVECPRVWKRKEG